MVFQIVCRIWKTAGVAEVDFPPAPKVWRENFSEVFVDVLFPELDFRGTPGFHRIEAVWKHDVFGFVRPSVPEVIQVDCPAVLIIGPLGSLIRLQELRMAYGRQAPRGTT